MFGYSHIRYHLLYLLHILDRRGHNRVLLLVDKSIVEIKLCSPMAQHIRHPGDTIFYASFYTRNNLLPPCSSQHIFRPVSGQQSSQDRSLTPRLAQGHLYRLDVNTPLVGFGVRYP